MVSVRSHTSTQRLLLSSIGTSRYTGTKLTTSRALTLAADGRQAQRRERALDFVGIIHQLGGRLVEVRVALRREDVQRVAWAVQLN